MDRHPLRHGSWGTHFLGGNTSGSFVVFGATVLVNFQILGRFVPSIFLWSDFRSTGIFLTQFVLLDPMGVVSPELLFINDLQYPHFLQKGRSWDICGTTNGR